MKDEINWDVMWYLNYDRRDVIYSGLCSFEVGGYVGILGFFRLFMDVCG